MIVISGISSGMGISLARRLAASGRHVRGFSRSVESVRHLLDHPNIELLAADIREPFAVRALCAKAEYVVHLAALSAPWGRYADFFQTNVLGTDALLQASILAGVRRFVHVSSPSLYFDFTNRLGITEKTPFPKRFVNCYAETKGLAEQLVDRATEAGLSCITVRPRAVFGPHDQSLFPRLLRSCRKGLPCFNAWTDLTYVDNAAQALHLAMDAPDMCTGQKYNITNGQPVLLNDFVEQLLSRLGHAVRRRRMPYHLAYAAAWIAEMGGCLRGREPALTRYGVGVLRYSQTFSIEKAVKELHYNPEFTVEEGVDRYVSWLRFT